MKYWIFLILLLPLVLAKTEDIWINPGENVTVGWNCTLGEDYIADIMCRESQCVFNETQTIRLDPGETIRENGINASCSSCNISQTSICSIDKSLKPGRDYSFKEGACDIEFECRDYDAPDCEDVLDTYTTHIEYTISRANDSIKIKLSDIFDKTFAVDDELDTFMTTGQIKAECPKFTDTDKRNLTFEQCAAYKDLFMSPQDYLHGYTSGFNQWTLLMNRSQKELSDCRSARDALKDDRDEIRKELEAFKVKKETELENMKIDLQNMEHDIAGPGGWQQQVTQCSSEKGYWKLATAILGMTTAILLVICFVIAVFSARRRRGGAQ